MSWYHCYCGSQTTTPSLTQVSSTLTHSTKQRRPLQPCRADQQQRCAAANYCYCWPVILAQGGCVCVCTRKSWMESVFWPKRNVWAGSRLSVVVLDVMKRKHCPSALSDKWRHILGLWSWERVSLREKLFREALSLLYTRSLSQSNSCTHLIWPEETNMWYLFWHFTVWHQN